jgi:DNA-damage-inducible protein J
MYLREFPILATTMVHVRVDEKTKQRAAETLAGMGISVSDAVRMLLVRVAAEKALPFEVKVPNLTTVRALRVLPIMAKESADLRARTVQDLEI